MSKLSTQQTVDYLSEQLVAAPSVKQMRGSDVDLLTALLTTPRLYMEELLYIQDKNGQTTLFN